LVQTPEDNEAFYREVDEELRRSQAKQMFDRYGLAGAVLIILLLAGLGGFFWWQNHRHVEAAKQAEQLNAIYADISSGKSKEVGPRLDQIVKEGNDGYRMEALLTKASIAVEAGDDAAAIASYKQIVADKDAAPPFRDLALIRQTALEYDKLAPAAVVERLKPLAVAGNPWFGSAGEMVGLAYLKQEKPELAAPIFAAVAKDTSVPATIRSRALQMAQGLGVDVVLPDAAGATKE
jgi:hypothetical protein